MKTKHNFLLLIVGQSLANIGDVLYIVAVISVLYTITESAAVSSFVPFTITAAMFVSSILTPLLIGNLPLKLLLAGSQIGKTMLLMGLAYFLMFNVDVANYYFIFLLITLIALLDGCANPIRQALIPHYVKEDQLLRANGIAETITQSIQIGTWFFGSLLLIPLSPAELVWLVVFLFAIASVILCLLQNVRYESKSNIKIKDQLTEGWHTIKAIPFLHLQARIELLETIASTVWIAAILYVYVERVLHEQEQWWGYINSAYFVGLVVGSIVCVRFSKNVEDNRYTFILAGAWMSFVTTILFSATSIPMIALILSACIGLFGQLKNIPQQTLIQISVSKEKLATVYTSLGTIGTGAFSVSSLIMGVLADLVGVRGVFVFSGALLAIVSFMIYRSKDDFIKGRKNIMERDVEY